MSLVEQNGAGDIVAVAATIKKEAVALRKTLEHLDLDKDTEQGVSFLEMKNQVLLSYVMNLLVVMGAKLAGRSLEENDSRIVCKQEPSTATVTITINYYHDDQHNYLRFLFLPIFLLFSFEHISETCISPHCT
eukprot:m.299811 g.299811  ORF g.299811 m.299811 type:complete len:133 (-) comp15874_c0_seq3:3704-4102(-)